MRDTEAQWRELVAQLADQGKLPTAEGPAGVPATASGSVPPGTVVLIPERREGETAEELARRSLVLTGVQVHVEPAE